MPSPNYWEDDFDFEIWNQPSSFETPKKPVVSEHPREVLTPDFLSICPKIETPNYTISSTPLENFSSPSLTHPTSQQTDDSGYWTPPNSSLLSLDSKNSSMKNEIQTPAKMDSNFLAKVLSKEADFIPKMAIINLTGSMETNSPRKPKTLLEQLIDDESPDVRPRTPEPRIRYESPSRRIRRVYKRRKRSDPKPEKSKGVPGPYQNSWLNEVYWFHFNDFMKTNYYDVMAASYHEMLQKKADQKDPSNQQQSEKEEKSENRQIEEDSSDDESVQIISSDEERAKDEQNFDELMQGTEGQRFFNFE